MLIETGIVEIAVQDAHILFECSPQEWRSIREENQLKVVHFDDISCPTSDHLQLHSAPFPSRLVGNTPFSPYRTTSVVSSVDTMAQSVIFAARRASSLVHRLQLTPLSLTSLQLARSVKHVVVRTTLCTHFGKLKCPTHSLPPTNRLAASGRKVVRSSAPFGCHVATAESPSHRVGHQLSPVVASCRQLRSLLHGLHSLAQTGQDQGGTDGNCRGWRTQSVATRAGTDGEFCAKSTGPMTQNVPVDERPLRDIHDPASVVSTTSSWPVGCGSRFDGSSATHFNSHSSGFRANSFSPLSPHTFTPCPTIPSSSSSSSLLPGRLATLLLFRPAWLPCQTSAAPASLSPTPHLLPPPPPPPPPPPSPLLTPPPPPPSAFWLASVKAAAAAFAMASSSLREPFCPETSSPQPVPGKWESAVAGCATSRPLVQPKEQLRPEQLQADLHFRLSKNSSRISVTTSLDTVL
ncbi:unnamed protein product [Protopolystoma xenopodis]|uniref:Uncharacterized protein n=1 Tax=Protopolystoma xenopodis TaxID=117903 RepID=A0A3S5CVA1_9PLAT|nr:unnamed protein product [Protopolystoma xenopodis]